MNAKAPEKPETFSSWFLKIRHHGICDASHQDGDNVYKTNGAMLVRAPKQQVQGDAVTHDCEVTGFYARFDWDWSKKREFFQFRSKALKEILIKKSEGKKTVSRAMTLETAGVRAITIQALDDKRDRIPLIKPWRGKDIKITLDGTWLERAASQADIIRIIPNILEIQNNKYRVFGVEVGDVRMAIAEILPKAEG